MKLRETLNRIMRERNIKGDADFAQNTGIDPSSLSRYLSGERNLGMPNLYKIYTVYPEIIQYLFEEVKE